MMAMRVLSDLAVFDQQGRPILAAEVKARPTSSPEWAAVFRRNLIAHGVLEQAPFFLLAAPDRLYFWSRKAVSTEATLPDISFDTAAVLGPYLGEAHRIPSTLSEASLELVVAAWLRELVAGGGIESVPPSAVAWFRSEGFLDAIRAGTLAHS